MSDRVALGAGFEETLAAGGATVGPRLDLLVGHRDGRDRCRLAEPHDTAVPVAADGVAAYRTTPAVIGFAVLFQ